VQNLTVIVIDDDASITDSFCEYLEILGLKVLGCGYNGKDAVELYQKCRPDLVFLDLMMPDYDGFYALERIRIIDPNSKIIVITADLKDTTVKLLDELKPTRILYKPYEPEQIMEILNDLKSIDCVN
jgi:CheY-like chemotaxis protein